MTSPAASHSYWSDPEEHREYHYQALFGALSGAGAGDISLAHGAMGVAITGGLANRIKHLLRGPEFAERFLAKGRYRSRMTRIPVKLVTTAEPGLLGAAVAFQRAHDI